MTPGERVHAALRRQPVDRVPIFMWFHPDTARRLAGLLEIPASRLSEAMGDDVRQTWVGNNHAMEGIVHEREGDSHIDDWSVEWVKVGPFNQIRRRFLKLRGDIRIMANEFFFATDHLLIWRPEDELDDEKIIRYIDFIEAAESARQSPFDRFNDLSRITDISISYSEVSEYAVRRRSYASSVLDRPARAAFYAINPVSYGMARMYQNLLDCAKMEVKVFQSLDEAASWLDVETSLLADASQGAEE